MQILVVVANIQARSLKGEAGKEHSGRYQYFAEHCVSHGFAVHTLDHWGHGKSTGINGFVPDFSVYHDGLDALIDRIPAGQRTLPLILVGHSLVD